MMNNVAIQNIANETEASRTFEPHCNIHYFTIKERKEYLDIKYSMFSNDCFCNTMAFVNLSYCRFIYTSFEGGHIYKTDFMGSVFQNCSFRDTVFININFKDSYFVNCTFDNCSFLYCIFAHSNIQEFLDESCDLNDCIF